MSFCQKHRNHHCIHAHHCTDKSHKKKKKCNTKESIVKLNRYANDQNLDAIAQENEQCQFNEHATGYEIGREAMKKELEKYIELNFNNADKIAYLTTVNSEAIKKYDKAEENNRHLAAQLEYYREQLERIVKCTDADIKNEIKRHIKENAEATIKIRKLSSRISDLQQEVQRLKLSNSELSKEKSTLTKKLRQSYEYTQKLEHQLKLVSGDNEETKKSNEAQQKKNRDILQKYQILVLETKNIVMDNKKREKALEQIIEQKQRQLNRLKNAGARSKQVQDMELAALKSNENSLLDKIKYLDSKATTFQRQNKQLTLKLQQSQKDLQHAKTVIRKQMEIGNRNKRIEQVTSSIVVNESSIRHDFQDSGTKQSDYKAQKENRQSAINSKSLNYRSEKQGSTERERQLLRQVHRLQQVVKQIEEKIRIEVKEEYIMMLGASEQLKKLLQEKNATIKKLIKEKGDILARV